jgi:hypothetical protein
MEQMEPTITTHAGDPRRKEGHMASTISSTNYEAECREFAREFPTPSVQRAIALCEAGTLGWAEVHELFERTLGHALATA